MSDSQRYNEMQLLGQISQGEEPAFRQLFQAYGQKVFSFALQLVRSTSLAEEITRELFLSIWARRSGLGELRHFQSWLSAMMQEHAYAALRSLARERRMLAGEPDNMRADFSSEYERLLQAAIDRLPHLQREVYLLRTEGLRPQAIAEKTGLRPGLVKSHLEAAVCRVRLFLETHGKAGCSCSSETG
jgi:RNA polymerase sigma-70 factor (ECF subfamily)